MRTPACLLVLAFVASCGGTVNDGTGPDGGHVGDDATLAHDGAFDSARDAGNSSSVCRKGGGQAVTLATGYANLTSIAASDGFVYWTDGANLSRVPVGGGTVATLGPAAFGPLVVDSHSAYASALDGDLIRIALDGGAETVIVHGSSLEDFGIAVQGSTVYWTENSGEGNGTIARESSGGDIVTLATGPVPSMLGIAGGRLYWSQRTTIGGGDASVVSTPLDGGPLATISGSRVASLGLGGPYVVIQGEDLYSLFGAITRVPLDGGAVANLGSDIGSDNIQAVTSDSDGIYWLTYGGVNCVPLGGTEPVKPVTLGDGPNAPHSNATIAVDETSVYWADHMKGIIAKISKL